MDKLIPFSIENTDFVGRFVKLEESIKDLGQFSKTDLPENIKIFLSDLRTVITLLGSSLKHNGNLSLTVRSDRYIKFASADYFNNGTIRSYASLNLTDEIKNKSSFEDLIGQGKLLLAMSYPGGKNYQSLIDISDHKNLSEVIEEYFIKSEQLPTYFKLSNAIKYNFSGKNLCAGGIILQNLSNNHYRDNLVNEKWEEIGILIDSLADDELVDKNESIEAVLYKLFHQYGVKIYEEKFIKSGCKCSRENFKKVIKFFDPQEIDSMYQGDKISVNCNFCGQEEIFMKLDFTE